MTFKQKLKSFLFSSIVKAISEFFRQSPKKEIEYEQTTDAPKAKDKFDLYLENLVNDTLKGEKRTNEVSDEDYEFVHNYIQSCNNKTVLSMLKNMIDEKLLKFNSFDYSKYKINDDVSKVNTYE